MAGGRGGRSGPVAIVAGVLLAGGLFAGPGAARPAQAQEDPPLRFGPTLLRADGKYRPGLRAVVDLGSSRLQALGAFPRESSWAVGVEVPLAWEADRNPETLRGEGRFGYEVSLFRPAPPLVDVDVAALHPDSLPRPWDRGFLVFELRAGAEAPQELDQADFVLGGTAMYLPRDDPGWWAVPVIRLDLVGVGCAGCEVPGDDDATAHFRAEGELGWNIPLDRGWVPERLRPVWLRLRGRGFLTGGMSDGLAQVRRTKSLSGRAEVAYRIDRSDWLHEVHLGWTGGVMPIREESRRAWVFGVSVTP